MHRLRLPAAAALLFLLCLFTPELGCKSDVEQQVALAQLAQTCLVNTDCSSPLVCAFQACHAECESSRDCQDGARCVAAARPYKVCQLEKERLCKRTTDCAEGLICGVDGECRDGCMTDSQCVEGQSCVSGTCADKSELDAGGQLVPVTSSARGAEGSPCVYVSDCNGTLLCRGQACLPECRADQDCGVHQVCKDARCTADGTEPVACTYNSDCNAKAGERCMGGGCRCSCVQDRDCPAGNVCDGCGCAPDPKLAAECAYNSDCKKPGQLCKSGTCACECQADQDCKTGQSCDGCGCVSSQGPVNGIVEGNVNLYSSLQLPLYRGVKEIHGGLWISSTVLADLGDTFDQLERVENWIQIQNDSALQRLSLPKLVFAQELRLTGASQLAALDVPLLEHADVILQQLPKLNQVSFPKLQVGTVNVTQVPLTELSFPLLQHATAVDIEDCAALTSVAMPELLSVDYDFRVRGNNTPLVVASFSAPKLASIGTADSGGQIDIFATKLTSLDGIFGALSQLHVAQILIQNNGALSQCAVQAFADQWMPMPMAGMVQTGGNVTCGQACNGSVCPG